MRYIIDFISVTYAVACGSAVCMRGKNIYYGFESSMNFGAVVEAFVFIFREKLMFAVSGFTGSLSLFCMGACVSTLRCICIARSNLAGQQSPPVLIKLLCVCLCV